MSETQTEAAESEIYVSVDKLVDELYEQVDEIEGVTRELADQFTRQLLAEMAKELEGEPQIAVASIVVDGKPQYTATLGLALLAGFQLFLMGATPAFIVYAMRDPRDPCELMLAVSKAADLLEYVEGA